MRRTNNAKKHVNDNRFVWSADLHTLIDGLLLGDGGLVRQYTKGVSFAFSQSAEDTRTDGSGHDRRALVADIATRFARAGLPGSITHFPAKIYPVADGTVRRNGSRSVFHTRSYLQLVNEFERFYLPNGNRQIPRDIQLDAKTLALWFMSDGCYSRFRHAPDRGRLLLYTNRLSREDVVFLAEQFLRLWGIEFHINKQRNGWILQIAKTAHIDRFFSVVTASNVHECCHYKLK